MTIQFNVHSLEETEQIANTLAGLLSPPDVITLEGDLGAGKTTFTQASHVVLASLGRLTAHVYDFETIRRTSPF